MDYSIELNLNQSTHDLLDVNYNHVYDENINIINIVNSEPFDLNYNENNKNNYILIYLLFFFLLIFFFYKN
jgi:hypothetical protein